MARSTGGREKTLNYVPGNCASEKDLKEAKGAVMPFIAFLIFFYTALTVSWILLAPALNEIPNRWVSVGLEHALNVALLILPVVVYILVFERANPLTYMRLTTLPHGRRLVISLAFVVAFVVLGAASALFLQGGSIRKVLDVPASTLLRILRDSVIVAFLEEPAFRGFIFRKLRERFEFQKANAATAFLFLCVHIPGWYLAPLHWGLISTGLGIFLTGWIFGLAMEISGTLWLPLLLHTLNNLGAIVFLRL
jgi:membrane protease YdiL (CAAX protease family)